MGGTSGCCVERDPQNEARLQKETKGELARKSKYNEINGDADDKINAIINSSIIPDTQTKKRGSIIHIDENRRGQTEDKKDDLYDIKQDEFENTKLLLSHDRASRASYDSENELSSSNSSKYSKSRSRHHKSSHSSHHHSPKRRHHKKPKNKLVSSLKECIDDFNKSMQSISVLQLMSTKPTINTTTSTYDQNELLDKKEIGKFFKEKKYDIQWFLLTKRNKFIKIMVNKWPNNISILTSIKLYDMLQEKLAKHTPSISQSSLNLVSSPYNNHKKSKVCNLYK